MTIISISFIFRIVINMIYIYIYLFKYVYMETTALWIMHSIECFEDILFLFDNSRLKVSDQYQNLHVNYHKTDVDFRKYVFSNS